MSSSNRIVLVFLLLGVLLMTLPVWTPIQASPSAQVVPCVSRSDGVFVFALEGYRANGDGSHTLTWQVTNHGQQGIGYVALGTAGWSRIQPQHGGLYPGELGSYRVEWTNDQGNPGFASVKYEAQFATFSQGATESFTLVVRNFDSAAPIQVQAKAGRTLGTAQFTLSTASCDRTPPTPTPTPFFSPLPTPAPDPALTVHDYLFGEPRILLTNTAELVVTDWLPDNETAIIVAASAPGRGRKQLVQTFNTRDGSLRTYGETGFMYPKIVWLAERERMAFLKTEPGTTAFYISDGIHDPVKIGTGLFGSGFAGRGDQVMALEVGASAPLLFNSDGQPLSLPPINLFDYGINQTSGPFGTNIRWHPSDAKVMLFDMAGLIVWDLQTNTVQPFPLVLDRPMWAISAEWSPNGEKIALALVEDDWAHSKMKMGILDMRTNAILPVPLPLTYISDLAWAPNSRQVIAAGHQRMGRDNYLSDLFLADSETSETRKIEPASGLFVPTYRDSSLAWSSDGSKLLYVCRLSGSNTDRGQCEINVGAGE